jgi:hypothetical protein
MSDGKEFAKVIKDGDMKKSYTPPPPPPIQKPQQPHPAPKPQQPPPKK